MDGSDFEAHRQFLVGVAYRMLGSVAEAEDVAQDAYLRWRGVDRAEIDQPRAYLARVVTRLCLDRLKSAQHRREHYVGTWLPEPIVDHTDASELADDLSVALLLTLDRLTPVERAAFLLHDVFDMDYAAIAGVLERSEAACRQLASRARDHVRAEQPRPRATPSPEAEARLFAAFGAALASGDIAALGQALAADAILYSDGGGKRSAALRPIYGRDRILRFFAAIHRKRPNAFAGRPARINGSPGFVLSSDDGVETLAIEIDSEHIVAIYAVRNPDKLGHITA